MSDIAIGSRIRTLRLSIGLSQTALAKELNVSQNIVSRYERGDIEPRLAKLHKIAQLVDSDSPYDIHWLVTGQSLAINNIDSVSAHRHMIAGPALTLPTTSPTDPAPEEFVLLPLYDVIASSGQGSLVDNERIIGHRAFNLSWLKEENIHPDSVALIQAKGDSMEPTIKSADTLLIDHSVNKPVDDGIYVIRYNDTLLVKRLQRVYDGSILVKSDNPAYETICTQPQTDSHQLQVIGRVVWIGRRI